MKYIFDFDRVLFDTDTFQDELSKQGLREVSRGPDLLAAIEQKKIVLSNFVNNDALEFLKFHGHESAIISSYVSRVKRDNDAEKPQLEFFQTEKIKRCGLFSMVNRVVVTARDKAGALQNLYEAETIFVDDELEHIEAGSSLGFRCVWYRTKHNRDQHAPAGVYSVENFREFVDLEATWNQRL